MLDHCLALRKNGVLLWRQSWAPMKGNPVDSLIRTVLMEERGGVDIYQDDASTVKWSIDNELDIIIVAIYQRGLVLQYIDELLTVCKQQFITMLRQLPRDEWDGAWPCNKFTATFSKLQQDVEKRAVEAKLQQKKPRSFADSKKFQNTRQGQKEQCLASADRPSADKLSAAAAAAEELDEREAAKAKGHEEGGEELTDEAIAKNIAKLKSGGSAKGGKPGAFKKKGSASKLEADDDAPKKGKEKRSWDEGESKTPGSGKGKGSGKEGKVELDFSNKDERRATARVFKPASKLDLDAEFGDAAGDDDDDDDDDSAEGAGGTQGSGKPSKGMMSAFRGLVSGRPLEQDQLQPIIDKLLDRLVSKNVAENIGQQVCESVCSSLLGKQVSSFASLSTTVKASMEGALTRILTPTRRVDLLADVQRARDEKRWRAVLTSHMHHHMHDVHDMHDTP